MVAIVRLFCVPWTVLTFAVRPVRRVARWLRPLVWVFALLAGGDLCRRGEWFPMVLLVLAVIATVTTPCFDRAWAARCQAMADDAVRRHLDPDASDPTAESSGGAFVVPPTPTRDGGS
ncbi:MAG: hypothetical protein QM619_08775 [Micropruina sp.]|uniref:hypothetical protein n=1 Tax=Micropruina sp. TaxID=2737536 RepID=UPI0039E50D7F